MTSDGDPKTTSDSQNPLQGLLSKCGIIIPTLIVRDRRASNQDVDRAIMVTANSRDKKRKRASRSPLPSSRMPIKMNEPRDVAKQPALSPDQSTKAVFEHLLNNAVGRKDSLDERSHLFDTETRNAWDFDASNKNLASNEKRAALIIRELREYERVVVFGNVASESLPGPETLDMGGQFLTNKSRIEQRSLLFRIAKEVPKGAILHLHFNAELNPERLLQEARSMPNMFVWSNQPILTQEDLELTEMMFNVMPANNNSADIFSAGYEGGGKTWKDPAFNQRVWMRWTEFMTRFKERFPRQYEQTAADVSANGNRTCSEPPTVELAPAENWIKSKMVLSESEAYDPTQTVNGVWARFNQATRCFKGLLNYGKVYEWYIGKAIDRMIDEKVMYAELRPMLMDKSIPADNGVDKLDNAAQMRLVLDAVDKKKAELDANGQGHLFPFGLKIIYCTPRSIPRQNMQKEMQDCIDLKIAFPDLICGFDLVGAEDRPNHIGFYFDELVAFQQTCKEKRLEIPFLFHAGESLLDTGGSTDPRNSNLFEAVAFNSKRIGHGFALMKHPQLVEKFRRREIEDPKTKKKVVNPGICVELCPISNELLHLCRNIKEHPYPELLAAKIPCTINSDNPSLFSNSMSHEFYQIMVGSPTITVHSWKQLALWSLEYSCLSATHKKEGERIFRSAWSTFCDWVVADFDALLAGDKINMDAANKRYKDLPAF